MRAAAILASWSSARRRVLYTRRKSRSSRSRKTALIGCKSCASLIEPPSSHMRYCCRRRTFSAYNVHSMSHRVCFIFRTSTRYVDVIDLYLNIWSATASRAQRTILSASASSLRYVFSFSSPGLSPTMTLRPASSEGSTTPSSRISGHDFACHFVRLDASNDIHGMIGFDGPHPPSDAIYR